MFREIFEKLLGDLQKGQKASPVFQHHISFVQEKVKWYGGPDYREEDPCQIVTDYIASMTDDYFLALHHFLFPKSSLGIRYHSYFADLQ